MGVSLYLKITKKPWQYFVEPLISIPSATFAPPLLNKTNHVSNNRIRNTIFILPATKPMDSK